MNSRSPDRHAVHLRFRGVVQGVGFRAYVQQLCRTAGIAGWVRNVDDGSVEAELVGSRNAVSDTVRRIRAGRELQISSIDQVEIPPPSLESSTFEIRH